MLRNQTLSGKKPHVERGTAVVHVRWWSAFSDLKNPIAYFPILLTILLLFVGASGQFGGLGTDIKHYQCYSALFWQGSSGLSYLTHNQCGFIYHFGLSAGPQAAFRILPFEYPPLTLTLFSLPSLVPALYYGAAFAVLMACFAFFLYVVLLRYGPRWSALVCTALLALAAFGTAEGRFDLVPALLTLLCVIAADRKRWSLAYVALAFGVLLKLYPLLLLPALFIAEQIDAQLFHAPSASLGLIHMPAELWQTLRQAGQWHWKNALIFCGLLIAVTGLFSVFNVQGAFISQLSYFANRPIQIESTGSTILWLGRSFGYPSRVVYTFGSFNFTSNLTGAVTLSCDVLFVVGYALGLVRQWQRKLDLTRTCMALILVFIVTGKVFSPQYLIWVIPLLAYSGLFNWSTLGLWTAVAALTTYIYPYLYDQAYPTYMLPIVSWFVPAVALRNILLLVVTLATLFGWFHFVVPQNQTEKS